MLSGTGTRANIGCPAAGKTGTTDNFNDAWFDGYTPHLATAVWVGYPNALSEMRSVHGIAVAGGTFPAMIWHKFMTGRQGQQLQRLPAPTSPISWSPFFGQYSQGRDRTDRRRSSPTDYGDATGGGYQGLRSASLWRSPKRGARPEPTSRATGGDGGTGGGSPGPTG